MRFCFISTIKYYDCPYCKNRKFIEISDTNSYYVNLTENNNIMNKCNKIH